MCLGYFIRIVVTALLMDFDCEIGQGFSHSVKDLLLRQVNDPVTIISSVLGYLNGDRGWGNGSKGKEESVQIV